MTVEVPLHSFVRLLFRWRGSIWQSVWKPLFLYLLLYVAVNVTYRLALPPPQKQIFEDVVSVIKRWTDVIPVQFILGFFVSYVIGQWWAMLTYLPYPDEFLYHINVHLNGMDPKLVKIRRTFARWCILLTTLVYADICPKLKRRFPEDFHLLKNGLISNSEYELYKNTTPDHGRWFVPVWWSSNLLARCHKEGLLSDLGLEMTTERLWKLRTSCGWLKLYTWINAPLRYIQITTFAVYGYFAVMLFTRQAVKETKTDGTEVDVYVPFLLIIEFIFYVGWLKVAEENLNPFGSDDDDFSINYLMDRNHHVSFMLVDELSKQTPEPTDDPFSTTLYPRLRHTRASYPHRDHIPEDKFTLRLNDDDRTVLPDFDHYAEPLPKKYRRGFVGQMANRGNKVFSAVHDAF